ncbi:amino acid ABC transporter substrate-binding protein, partial [Streptomyces sp. SID11233]|nr:amino acid ABC transporter substrate-binding protein [Streptomyces sp. SID11233]
TACGGDSLEDNDKGSSASKNDDGGDKKGSLVIGAARFTEAKVMAELYAGVLKDAGYSTTVKTVQNREVYEPELRKGSIDVVPE